jgi:hypothetical protein
MTKRRVILTASTFALATVITIAITRNRTPKQFVNESFRASSAGIWSNHKTIHRWLTEYAMENDGTFPDLPGTAEANFRAVIPAVEGPDTSLYADPPGYATAYIAGLDGSDNGQQPLLITALIPTLAWLTGQSAAPLDPGKAGPVFITSLSGSVIVGYTVSDKPLVGGPDRPSAAQVRFSASFQF